MHEWNESMFDVKNRENATVEFVWRGSDGLQMVIAELSRALLDEHYFSNGRVNADV